MALLGDLEAFPIDDVLRHLGATGRTGCIAIEGGPAEVRLWLDHGRLVATDVPWVRAGVEAAETMFELLRCPAGSFTFSTDRPELPLGREGYAQDVEVVLAGAYLLLDEWYELLTVVPSLDHHIALRPRLDSPQVVLDAPSWRTLVAVGAGKSVAQLATALDVGELESLRRTRDLLALGVATLVDPMGSAHRGQTSPDR